MRTTLDIDDDILAAVKDLARREGCSAGRLASKLLRQALTGASAAAGPAVAEPPAVYGIQPFDHRGGVVTPDLVNSILDEEGI